LSSLVNIGFGNIVNLEKMTAIIGPESAPAKRMVKKAKSEGFCIDGTHGRKAKSVIVMENGSIVLSSLAPETLMARIEHYQIQSGRNSDAEY